MRLVIVVLFGFVVAPRVMIAVEQAAPARPVPGDAQDLVLFLVTRPCLIRLHLQIKGRSFRVDWEETIGHLFRYLDVDGDGVLRKKEADLAPSKTQWVQLMSGAVVEPDAAPPFAELADNATAAKIHFSDFSRYYRNSGAGALQIEWGWRPANQNRLSNALFQRLDTNKDDSLSRAELLAARKTLHLFDANDDDLIQTTELIARGFSPPFSFRSSSDEQPVPAHFPFAIVQPDVPAATLAAAILNRYDRDKDRRLSRMECRLEKAAFARLDGNRDERLDAAELEGWRDLPPDLELVAPLEQGTRKDILILPPADGKGKRLPALRPTIRDGAVRVPLADKQLEVARYDRRAKARQELLKQLRALAGKDGILSEKQIYQPPFTFVAMLRLADRNSDNRLSYKEVADYLEVQDKFLFRTSYLTVVDRGASLFEFVDADHDGRLSPRELNTAWQRLSPWQREGSEGIPRRQLPRQFQLVLSYGPSRPNRPNAGPGFANLPLVRDRSRGPLWFRKMDRNGDGDVSATEFLGTIEQFRRIDSDGDGLIDATEAECADKDFRG